MVLYIRIIKLIIFNISAIGATVSGPISTVKYGAGGKRYDKYS